MIHRLHRFFERQCVRQIRFRNKRPYKKSTLWFKFCSSIEFKLRTYIKSRKKAQRDKELAVRLGLEFGKYDDN